MGRHKKNKTSPLIKYLFTSMLIITAVALGLIKFIDIFPGKYFTILVGVFVIICFVLSCFLFNRKPILKILGGLTTTAYMFIMIIAIVYELNTIDFLKKIGESEYSTLNYSVLVLEKSNVNKLSDLKNEKMGLVEDNFDAVSSMLNKKVNVKYEKYDFYTELTDKLQKEQIKAIVIEDSLLDILRDENLDVVNKSKVIDKFSVDVKQKDIKKKVNVTKKPFNIYISGIDTYGKINSVSRSDVNMVLTVNPKKKTILITSIPRDYFVKLHGYDEYDKLTHAGIYGVNTSVKTVEDIFGIKINYYVKVNFTSLVKIVDTIDGIDVNSKYAFISQDGYKFNEGKNHLNGKEALSFTRERKNLPDGDRSRVENHQEVLSAIINKSLNKNILSKYNSLIKSLKPSMVTNFTNSEITSFIKMQLKHNYDWKIEYVSLDGTDGYEYTYSYPKNKLYVMIPSSESVEDAINKINENMKK